IFKLSIQTIIQVFQIHHSMHHNAHCFKNYRRQIFVAAGLICSIGYTSSQNHQNNPASNHGNKFEQLGTILPTPNEYRNASGAPGHKYWQQKADYDISARLDEEKLTLFGEEKITYYNQSPDALGYLWLQLDENQHKPDNEVNHFNENKLTPPFTQEAARTLRTKENLAGLGTKIESVKDEKG